MAVVSIVPFDEIADATRWDAEFYQPRFRELGRRFRKTCKKSLTDFVELSETAFDPTTVEEFNYAEISRVDTSCGQIETIKVKSTDTPDRAQTFLSGGEILVSTVRPNRSLVGLVPYGVKDWVATSGFATLSVADRRYRSALFAWLKTKEMADWLDRHTTASMYPAVAIPDVLNSPFPHLSDSALSKIHELISEMEVALEKGRQRYPEAEAEVLERIGWQDLSKKPCELYYTEDFEALAERERIDAEHHQPKYKRLCERLRSIGAKTIGDFAPEPCRGIQPEFFEDGDILVIDSKAVRPQGVEPDKAGYVSRKFYESTFAEKGRVSRGDILLNSTGMGTLGRASFYNSNDPALADNHVAIIRPDPKVCLPVYLSLFLNSPAGLAQSEMFQTGSSGQLEIYPQHIHQILVYLPRTKTGKIDLAWQEKVATKVLEAARARVEARVKLDKAKQLVEDAIGSGKLDE